MTLLEVFYLSLQILSILLVIGLTLLQMVAAVLGIVLLVLQLQQTCGGGDG